MLTAIWTIALVLLGLWSLLSWGLYALLSMDAAWVADVGALLRQIPYSDVIERWVPGWQGLAQALLDLTQALLRLIGQYAPLVTIIVWAIGAALLLGTAGVLSLIVALLREKKPTPATA